MGGGGGGGGACAYGPELLHPTTTTPATNVC